MRYRGQPFRVDSLGTFNALHTGSFYSTAAVMSREIGTSRKVFASFLNRSLAPSRWYFLQISRTGRRSFPLSRSEEISPEQVGGAFLNRSEAFSQTGRRHPAGLTARRMPRQWLYSVRFFPQVGGCSAGQL